MKKKILMASPTLDRLKIAVKEAIEYEKECFGETQGWLANPENLMKSRRYRRVHGEWEEAKAYREYMEKVVSRAVLIETELRIDKVRLGSRVLFDLGGLHREFVILGDFDGATRPTWMTANSPIAKLIMGLRKGDEAYIGKEIITILDIKPSDF